MSGYKSAAPLLANQNATGGYKRQELASFRTELAGSDALLNKLETAANT